MSALPSNPADRTFGDFLIAEADHGLLVPDDFPRRLKASAGGINSLTKLQTWARLRWPDWYTRRGGKDHDGPTGKQVMALLWADYLAWAEAA